MTSGTSSARPWQGFNTSVRSLHWMGLTLLLLALLAALPLWNGPGMVNTRGGGDSPFLFFRLHQLMANLREGVFPVRWMPDAAYGLGYPFFNFYAALPYYLAAIFNFIGIDLLASIKIVQTLGFVCAGFALYGWARRHFTTRSASWLVAVAYVYAPFHFVNVYVRGDSLSEFYAFIFFPLILWSIDRIYDSARNWPLLALSYSGLILTHNVSALIFSPFVVLYALIYLLKSKNQNPKSKIAALALGLSLAFALSAFFWLPALGEASLTQVSDVQTTGYFNYSEHFRWTNLIQNSIGFDYAITTAPGSNSPFAMGLAQAIGTAAGLVVLILTWKKDSHQRFRLFVLIGLALSTVMITPLSKPLWDVLPLLSYAQFPWRFLSIQALFTSLTMGYLAYSLLPPVFKKLSLAPIIGLALIASMLFTLHPDYLPIRAEEITPDRLQLYEAFSGNIGTTIRAEYLPRTMIPRPYTGPILITPRAVPLHPIVSQGEATGAQVERRAITQRWQVEVASDNATLSFPITYWPGWQARVDGQAVETRATPDLGYLQIDVPHGEHRIELQLGNTPIRTGGDITSLIAGIMLLSALVILARKAPGQQSTLHFNLPMALAVLVVGVGLALVVITAQQAQAFAPRADDLTLDFVDKPWLHHNPGGAKVGGALLKSYHLGQSFSHLALDSEWYVAPGTAVTGTVALVTPATHLLPGGPSPIAEQAITWKTGDNQIELDPPYELASGLYYVTVQVGGVTQFLQPLWIDSSKKPFAAPQFGSLTPAIGLAAAQTQLHDPNHLDVLLHWTISSATAANYGISLRWHDPTGKVWTSLDTQPGYGFQPTSAWQPGTLNDVYTLELPPDLPRDQAYALDVILYRIASKEEVGRTTIDGLRLDPHDWRSIEPPAHNFVSPALTHPLDAIFDDQIQLLGYELNREGDVLKIDLAWKALRNLTYNYKVFAHVFDPATETIVAQWDAMPRDNAYPTSRWIADEVVTETLTIPLMNVPPGEYRITLGLYDPPDKRLPVSGGAGVDASNRRVILEENIRP